ncbi:MAG: hypothetical protein JW700_00060 [Candidatus Aenigmarchaeota archaeon]|nr:hypothetical protein [Candidatus Aenigmarchaeota archaeon]
MTNMKMISKEQALGVACEDCRNFINSHEMVEGTPSYITKSNDCRKCKLQIDMMSEKIAVIWKEI